MKCPICDGMGTSNTCVNGTFKPCSFCNGKGYYEIESSYGTERVKCHCQREQTNEEYLRSCTTEELAEALFRIMASNEFTMYLIHTEKKSVQDIKDTIMKWLKEKHE